MIKIPEVFQSKLNNSLSNAAVTRSIHRVSDLLEGNCMYFFPEYTNHGIKHVEAVLNLAAKVIDNETVEQLSEKDIEVLVGATLMHDIGMHINYSGFMQLLSEKPEVNEYSDCPWSKLWKDFFDEAMRWDKDTIEGIFGEDIKIENPLKAEQLVNKNDQLLIGEFLRRHHDRLAYEIAINGFPSNSTRIKLLETSEDEVKFFVGHVARSHGKSLWKAADVLNECYGAVRDVSGVKIIYLMAVLRVADFFDIDESRANTVVWNVKKIDSKISKDEWERHKYIDSIDFNYQDDKETIYVRIKKPSTSNMFLKIESYFDTMQEELDNTWAVIGKYYSRYGAFKLKFRRVQSNLNQIKEKVNYITEKVNIDVNKNILLYLAQPLYGSNPSYGIRELLQNATDACREKKFLIKDEYVPKVSLKITEEECGKYFIIKDNGIGMDKNVIIKYFLIAGSSFRNDNQWKKRFVSEEGDIVIRNGKFGVGVIAAFLLGEKIKVETVPLEADIKFSFETSLNVKQIEVLEEKVDSNEDSGTIIRIELDDVVYEQLRKQWHENWNSYYLYSDNDVPWDQWYKEADVVIDIEVPAGWRSKDGGFQERMWDNIDVDEYECVKWSYDKLPGAYRLMCNGIIIPNAYQIKGYDFPRPIKLPLVSVVDKNGRMALDLSRKGLENNILPFEKSLMRGIYLDILNKLEAQNDLSKFSKEGFVVRASELNHPSIDRRYHVNPLGMHVEELIFNKLGHCVCYDYCLQKLEKPIISKIWTEDDLDITNNNLLNLLGDNIVISKREMPNSIDSYKTCLDMNNIQNLGDAYVFTANWILMKKEKYEYLFDANKSRLRTGFVEDIKKVSENDTWVFLCHKDEKLSVDINLLGDLSNISLIVQYKYERTRSEQEQSEKNQLFNNILSERYRDSIFVSSPI